MDKEAYSDDERDDLDSSASSGWGPTFAMLPCEQQQRLRELQSPSGRTQISKKRIEQLRLVQRSKKTLNTFVLDKWNKHLNTQKGQNATTDGQNGQNR